MNEKSSPIILKDKEKQVDFDLKKVISLLGEKKNLNEVVLELGIPWESFIQLYHKNLQEIRNILRKDSENTKTVTVDYNSKNHIIGFDIKIKT
jgi:hypothetical protein